MGDVAQVELRMTEPLSPVALYPQDDENHIHVIMPMQVQ
jgi:DNA polymerase III sliding clamp (beta) subunit (PCNA family)